MKTPSLLQFLEFNDFIPMDGSEGDYFQFTGKAHIVRVFDNDGITLYVLSHNGVLEWKAQFTHAPASVVISAIKEACGIV